MIRKVAYFIRGWAPAYGLPRATRVPAQRSSLAGASSVSGPTPFRARIGASLLSRSIMKTDTYFYLWREQMLPHLSIAELIVLLVVVLLIFGPQRLPDLAASFGKSI